MPIRWNSCRHIWVIFGIRIRSVGISTAVYLFFSKEVWCNNSSEVFRNSSYAVLRSQHQTRAHTFDIMLALLHIYHIIIIGLKLVWNWSFTCVMMSICLYFLHMHPTESTWYLFNRFIRSWYWLIALLHYIWWLFPLHEAETSSTMSI